MRRSICTMVFLSVVAAAFIVANPPALATYEGTNGRIAAVTNGSLMLFDPTTGASRPIFDSIYFQQEPAWSPDGGWLAFGEAGKMTVARADGSGRKSLGFVGTAGGFRLSPTWNPDGVHVAFLDSGGRIHTAARDGSEKATFGGPEISSLAYGPDGATFAYTKKESSDLSLMDVNGSNQHALVTMPATPRDPDWSPDGTKIAFESGRDIWVINADGSGLLQLTSGSPKDTDPSWSPDGLTILFRRDGTADGLFTMSTDGTDVAAVPGTSKLVAPAWQPQWIGVHVSKTVITQGGASQLVARLAWPTEAPDIVLQKRSVDGSWKTFATPVVDATGRFSTTVTPKENTLYRAVWAGDSTHGAVTSVATEVYVRTIVTGHLRRYFATQGRYRLYHAGSVVVYDASVSPNQAGHKLCFELDRFGSHSWIRADNDCFKIGANGSTRVYVSISAVGTKWRIRARFDDEHYLPGVSSWAYFRITS